MQVKMETNLLFTVFQQKMTFLMHNMSVVILPIFFCYIVTGTKQRLLGALPLLPPPGRFGPVMLSLITPELTKSLHDSDTIR